MQDWSSGLTRCWNSSSVGCLELLQHWIEPQWYHLVKLEMLSCQGCFALFAPFCNVLCSDSQFQSVNHRALPAACLILEQYYNIILGL
jgi:hypothetical protein